MSQLMVILILISVLLLCAVNSIDADRGSNKIVKIFQPNFTIITKTLSKGKKINYISHKWFEVASDTPFQIVLRPAIVTITCSTLYYENQLLGKQFQLIQNGSATTIDIPRGVSDTMNGVWWCRSGRFYNYYFKIRVKDVGPPQTMLVNNVILPTKKYSSRDYSANYYYTEDDEVHIACISSVINCTVRMKYNTTASFYRKRYGSWGVHFSYKLRTEYKNRTIVCLSDCSGITTYLKVIFVLKSFNNKLKIQINGQLMKGVPYVNGNKYFYINYGYFLKDNEVNITCSGTKYTDSQGLTPKLSSCKNCNVTVLGTLSEKIIIHPDEFTRIVYSAKRKNSYDIPEQVIITFTPITPKEVVISGQAANSNQSNIFLEPRVYESEDNKSLLNHTRYYNDGDIFNCNGTSQHNNSLYVVFNGSESGEKPVPIQISDVTEKNTNALPGIKNDGASKGILVTVLILIAIILAITVVGIFKPWKKNRHNQRRTEDENDTLQNNYALTIRSNYVQENAEYTVPGTQNLNNAHNTDIESLYAKAVPKSQRPHLEKLQLDTIYTYPSKIYEEVQNNPDISNNAFNSEDVYSQVLPKSLRGDKISADNGYMVNISCDMEPTYSDLNFMRHQM